MTNPEIKLLNFNLEVAYKGVFDEATLGKMQAFKDELYAVMAKHEFIPLSMAVFEFTDPDDLKDDDLVVKHPFDLPNETRGGYISPKLTGRKKTDKLN